MLYEALKSRPTLAVALAFALYGVIGAAGMAFYNEGPAPGLLVGILFAVWGGLSMGAIGLTRSLLGYQRPVLTSFIYWLVASSLGLGAFVMPYILVSPFRWMDLIVLGAVALLLGFAATIYEFWLRTRDAQTFEETSTEA